MKKLVQGAIQFEKEIFKQKEQLFKDLVEGQHPHVLFITCSDSRIVPSLITQANPAELFVIRNAGNIIPPHNAANGGEEASIDYAVNVLGVEHIVVCGHSHCGVIGCLIDQLALSVDWHKKCCDNDQKLEDVYDAELVAKHQLKSLSRPLANWLSHAEATKGMMQEDDDFYNHSEKRPERGAQLNVLAQLQNIRTLPCVARKLLKNEVVLHGWYYCFETGCIFEYQPETNTFITLEAFYFPERKAV
jgi:carbonic anhydrase